MGVRGLIMNTNYKEEIRYKTAKKRVKEIKGFYIHLAVYLVINTMLIAYSSDWIYDTSTVEISGFGTAFLWGIGLFAHWASVFMPNIFLGKNWEERKIKELMDKEKETQNKWK